MNYRLGFFILAIALGGLVSYLIFKPKEVNHSAIEAQYKESKRVEDSLISELNKTKYELSILQNELENITPIYDTITKPALMRRSDSLYFRYGLY